MMKKTVLQKGVHLESVCSLFRESNDLKGKNILPDAPMSPAFLHTRGARLNSVEGPDVESGTGQRAPRTCMTLGRREWVSCLPETTAKPKEASSFIW